MNRTFSLFLILLLASLACRFTASDSKPANIDAPTRTPSPTMEKTLNFSAVDSHINAFLSQKNLDGAALIVTDSNGEVVYQRNYGANFDENTVVPIASATKWLTGATVMTLVDDGLISSLDDPVSKYLPYFADKGAKSDITILQMLAFTSGLPDHIEVQDDPNITQQDECAYVAENVELLRDPGTGFEYGGLQEELAACVAETVTGKPFREIMQERLLDPLGMTDTQLANMVNRNPRNPDYASANPLTSGGIYSDASDLIKFSQMILAGGSYNGNQILAPETVQAMAADQTFGIPLYKTIWAGEAENQWRYGLGNWVQVLDPTDNSPEEEAKRIVSSEGAFGASEWVDFDLQYAAAFTIWARPGAETTAFVNDLKNLVSEAVESAASPPEPAAVQEAYATLMDEQRNREIKVKAFFSEKQTSPLPLVLLSHGFGETYDSYDYLAEYLASQGYVVLAINHPDRDRAAYDAQGIAALANPQLFDTSPQDIRFVLYMVMADGVPVVAGKVDKARIGVAGHSFGSTNALQMAGLTLDSPAGDDISYRDPRILAAVAMSPQIGSVGSAGGAERYGIHEFSWDAVKTPALLLWGAEDTGFGATAQDPNARNIAYESIPGADTFKAVIAGAEHHAFTETEPWYQAGERDARHHAWIQEMITTFFDAHLLGDEQARAWLVNNEMQTLTNGEVQQASKAAPVTASPAAAGDIASIETFTLLDAARDKNLQMRITFPGAAGIYPVIILSHYSGGTKDSLLDLQTGWANAGYVVISPDHSDSPNVGGTRGEYDLEDRAKDLSFIIESLALIENGNPSLQGKINNGSIGVAGQYLGAHTASLLGGADFGRIGKTYKNENVDAILLMSPTGTGEGFTESSWLGVDIPMMVITGSNDHSSRTDHRPQWRAEPFQYSCPGDKHLLFIEGLDYTYGGLTTNTRADETIIQSLEPGITAFWNAYLLGDPAAESFLKSEELNNMTSGGVDSSWK